MIAVKRLQSLFWVLLVALGALGAYLVSLSVATERNELMRVRAQIASARADIRYLETEFAARASMRQLEQWNAEDFRYSALSAEHYLDSERDLAHLDGVEPNGPTYVAQPVMVAMVESGDAVKVAANETVARPAALQIRADAAALRPSAPAMDGGMVRTASALKSTLADGRVMLASTAGAKAKPERVSLAQAETKAKPTAPDRRAERLSLLDSRLLDDRTLGEIGKRAAAEITGARR